MEAVPVLPRDRVAVRSTRVAMMPLLAGSSRAAAVFALAVCARLVYVALYAGRAPDSALYESLATALLTHHQFVVAGNPIAVGPGYPFFLALLQWMGGSSLLWYGIAQSMLDAVVAVIVFLLTRQVASTRWATAAAVVYAVHPGAVFLSSQVLTESLFTAMLAAAIGLFAYGLTTGRSWASALGGAALGAAILTRSIALFLPLAIVGAAWLVGDPDRRRRHTVIFLASTMAIALPWIVRCSLLARHLVLVQGHAAINFYVPTRWDLDQTDYATTWAAASSDQSAWWLKAAAHRPPASTVPSMAAWVDAEADRYGYESGRANIRANPGSYLRSRARAWPRLFLTSYDAFTGINASFRALAAARAFGKLMVKASLFAVFSLAPIVLAVAGLRRSSTTLVGALCAASWIYCLAIHGPLWIEYRFWQPFVPFVLVSAAIGLGRR